MAPSRSSAPPSHDQSAIATPSQANVERKRDWAGEARGIPIDAVLQALRARIQDELDRAHMETRDAELVSERAQAFVSREVLEDPRSDQWRLRCWEPGHDDERPSVVVRRDDTRNAYRCWVCHERWQSTIDLVVSATGWSLGRAIRFILRVAKDAPELVAMSAAVSQEAAKKRAAASRAAAVAIGKVVNQMLLIEHERRARYGPGHSPALREWLTGRGFSEDTDLCFPSGDALLPGLVDFAGVKAYRRLEEVLGTEVLETAGFYSQTSGAPKYGGSYRAMLVWRDPHGTPCWVQGVRMAWTPRRGDTDGPPKYLGPSGSSPRWPFNADQARGGRILVVCEGAMDALAANVHLGVPAIAVPSVTNAWAPHWASLFADPTGRRRWDRLVVAFDGGPAGRHGARRFAEGLRSTGLEIPLTRWQFPPGADGWDVNDTLVTYEDAAEDAAEDADEDADEAA